MAELIRMPKMSDTMQQGIISRWLKQVGDKVVAGDMLAEVETDKATMELEAYEEGTLLYIGVAAKSAAQVNDIIAIIGEAGEDISALIPSAAATDGQPDAPTAPDPQPDLVPPMSALPVAEVTQTVNTAYATQPCVPPDRFFASPLAKKIAKEKGYDVTQIQGSGEAGRVVKKDVIRFSSDALNEVARCMGPGWTKESHQDLPISSMRQTIAKVLTESKMTVPHFYLTVRINMNKMVTFRAALNGSATTKISINDLIIKATALALTKHPKINAAWLSHTIRTYQHIHIGVAIALEDGLMVPVVRFVDQKPLLVISKEVKMLYEKAQQKKLSIQDCTGATFTISNLGMLGIESFAAIVNPPAACILAVGAMQQIPIVQEDQIVPAHMMKVTLSCDHRVVDGAVGALFLSTLKELMEQPFSLLI